MTVIDILKLYGTMRYMTQAEKLVQALSLPPAHTASVIYYKI